MEQIHHHHHRHHHSSESKQKTRANRKIAKRIGSKYALISISLGLSIAAVFMIILSNASESWTDTTETFLSIIMDFKLIFGFSVLVFYFSAYMFGKIAGKQILLHGRNYILVGIVTGFLILISATLTGSLVGFMYNVGNASNMSATVNNYFYKPITWVILFGTVPVLAVGSLYGYLVIRQKRMLKQ